VTTVFMLSWQPFFFILLSLSSIVFRLQLFIIYLFIHLPICLISDSFISIPTYLFTHSLLLSFSLCSYLISFSINIFIYIPFFSSAFSLCFFSNSQLITSYSLTAYLRILIPPSLFSFFCYISSLVRIFSVFSSSSSFLVKLRSVRFFFHLLHFLCLYYHTFFSVSFSSFTYSINFSCIFLFYLHFRCFDCFSPLPIFLPSCVIRPSALC
jgi:hypothetical protein